MQVHIVVLHTNGSADTGTCLESLNNLKSKTLVNWHIIENTGQGFAYGCNKGITEALEKGADYVLLLNNDTVVSYDLLEKLIAVNGDITSPKTYYWGTKLLQPYYNTVEKWTGRAINVPTLSNQPPWDTGQYDGLLTSDWVSGCCMLIKKEVFDKIGLLDEQYLFYWEDIDFCYMARKAGFTIKLVPNTYIWHKKGVSTTSTFKLKMSTRNRIRFMRKHSGKWQLFVFFLYYFGFHLWASLLFYLVIESSWQNEKAIIGGVYEGLR